MISEITKPKIPKKYAYVLKTNQLKQLLEDRNITIDVQLAFWLPEKTGSILEAHFRFPNEIMPHNHIYTLAGALFRSDVQSAKEQLVSIVFPAFIKWLDFYTHLPCDSTHFLNRPYFNAIYSDKGISIVSK
jgi:hypothetical protein